MCNPKVFALNLTKVFSNHELLCIANVLHKKQKKHCSVNMGLREPVTLLYLQAACYRADSCALCGQIDSMPDSHAFMSNHTEIAINDQV